MSISDDRDHEDERESREFFLRTRKEAIVAGVIWAIFFVWVVGVSYVMGYGDTDITTTFGMPSWVFWGCLVPFVVATIVNSVFTMVFLKDDDSKL